MKIFLLCLSLITLCAIQAQDNYVLFTEADGLPTKEVYELYHDKKGFLWVGHALGISRYNGNRFTHYSHPQQNSLGISNIREDAQGRIWCRNFGAQIFYIENNKMQLLNAFDWKTQKTFPSFCIDKNNKLIVTQNIGLFVYDIDTKQSNIILPQNNNNPSNNINSIVLYKNNCIVSWSDFKLYSIKNNSLKQLYFKGKSGTGIDKYPILADNVQDTIYLLNFPRDTAIACIIQKDTCLEIRRFAILQGTYNIININKLSKWVCAKTGALNLANPNQKITNFSITSVSNDNHGNLWFSSLQVGIGYLKNVNLNPIELPIKLNKTDIVQVIEAHNNQLAISTNLGYVYFYMPNKPVKAMKEPNNQFISAFNSTSNKLYAGGTFLSQLHTNPLSFKKLVYTSSVKDIAIDKFENFYVANAYNLLQINKKNKSTILRPKRCRSVKWIEKNNTVYAAFSDGVFGFENKNAKELLANNNSLFATSLTSYNDTLVVGTINNGVYLFYQNQPIHHYSINKGLISNRILKVKYLNNKLWILSTQGIDCIDKDGWISHYTQANVLPNEIITDYTIYQNQLIVATSNKLYSINTNQTKDVKKPKLFIDNMLVNGNETVLENNIHLAHNLNNLTFTINGLLMPDGKNLYYLYRLINSGDTSWKKISAAQYVLEFPAIIPGSYTLQVKAINTSGVESDQIAYSFKINNPWWQTWWFYFSIIGFITVVSVIIFRRRLKYINYKNTLLLDRLNLQGDLRESMLTAIKSQMNPHFVFNALNTIQSYIYTNDGDKASNYLGKFSDLMRMILDNSQKKSISLAEEIETLRLYTDLELMRFENNMECTIYVDPLLPLDQVLITPMLLQPYVENAIKHGLLHKQTNRLLSLSFNYHQNNTYLQICIEDNGIGRQRSAAINKIRDKSYASFATFANQNRFDLLNQTLTKKIEITITDLYDKTGQAAGTNVTLLIPL